MRFVDVPHYAEFPKLDMTLNDFYKAMNLPEYSSTRPTGVSHGKKWRRHDGACDRQFIADGGKPVWLIGEYDVNEETDTYVTHMYRIKVRVRAPSTKMVIIENRYLTEEMSSWIEENLGYLPNLTFVSYIRWAVRFKTESDAVAFTLRWIGA
jgi:hypothetical protein